MTRRALVGGPAPRVLVSVLLVLGLGATGVEAQTSLFGIRGLGHPGRGLSARGRGIGGGVGVFDPGATINPGAVGGFAGITVEVMAETDLRGYSIGSVSVDGLSSTRFPLAQLGGRIGRSPLSFAVGFSQYTERSYDLTNADTIEIRGVPVGFEERTTSRGGMSDLRLALAYRVGPRLQVGAGLHLLTGSAKLQFSRLFADSAYLPYRIETDESLDGLGVSAGVVWSPMPRMTLGVSARSDSRADITVDSAVVGTVDLPITLAGGVQLAPMRPVRWSTTVVWRSWGQADSDLTARAFDTWEIGTGIELGGPESGVSRFPLRLGYRYAMLPFSPTDEQPHEVSFALGAGAAFAGNRGLVDVAIERVFRNGAGARETAWELTWTVTVRP